MERCPPPYCAEGLPLRAEERPRPRARGRRWQECPRGRLCLPGAACRTCCIAPRAVPPGPGSPVRAPRCRSAAGEVSGRWARPPRARRAQGGAAGNGRWRVSHCRSPTCVLNRRRAAGAALAGCAVAVAGSGSHSSSFSSFSSRGARLRRGSCCMSVALWSCGSIDSAENAETGKRGAGAARVLLSAAPGLCRDA